MGSIGEFRCIKPTCVTRRMCSSYFIIHHNENENYLKSSIMIIFSQFILHKTGNVFTNIHRIFVKITFPIENLRKIFLIFVNFKQILTRKYDANEKFGEYAVKEKWLSYAKITNRIEYIVWSGSNGSVIEIA